MEGRGAMERHEFTTQKFLLDVTYYYDLKMVPDRHNHNSASDMTLYRSDLFVPK